jgi:hypothetical protein
MTLSDLVDEFLEIQQAEPVTIAKLRWLLAKAIAVLGEVRLADLSPKQVYAWRLTMPEGHRFRSDAGAATGAQSCGRLGPHRLQPGQAGHPQRAVARAGEATLRIVAADRRCRREARPRVRADGDLRGGDRPTARRSRRSRRKRLRRPRLQQAWLRRGCKRTRGSRTGPSLPSLSTICDDLPFCCKEVAIM